MPVEKQSGVGSLTPGSYLVFKIMNCSLWTCSKNLMPYSIQFVNNYKFLLWPLLGPAFLPVSYMYIQWNTAQPLQRMK